MNGMGSTVKNTVLRKVLSGEVVIGSPEELAQDANQICQVDSLYLPTAEIPDEPEDVQYSSSIPDTLKTHRVVRGLSKHKIPYPLIRSHIKLNDMAQNVDTWRMDKMRKHVLSALNRTMPWIMTSNESSVPYRKIGFTNNAFLWSSCHRLSF